MRSQNRFKLLKLKVTNLTFNFQSQYLCMFSGGMSVQSFANNDHGQVCLLGGVKMYMAIGRSEIAEEVRYNST